MNDAAAVKAQDTLKVWGSRIVRRRAALGKITQAELAELIDPPIAQSTIAKIETAAMFPSDILKVRIADALRVEPDYLWNWDLRRP